MTSTAALAMELHSHNAEMEGMVKTIREELKDNITRELKDSITRFRLSNFYFLCWGRNMRSGSGV